MISVSAFRVCYTKNYRVVKTLLKTYWYSYLTNPAFLLREHLYVITNGQLLLF